MGIETMDIEKRAATIEADAGASLPDLRQALAKAKAGVGRITMPEQVLQGLLAAGLQSGAPRPFDFEAFKARKRVGLQSQ